MTKLPIFVVLASILTLLGCSSSASPSDASKSPPGEDAGGELDAGSGVGTGDAGGTPAPDAGPAADAGSDAGERADAGGEDAGFDATPFDTGVDTDAGEDAGQSDSASLYCCTINGADPGPMPVYKASCGLPDGGSDIYYSAVDGGIPCPEGASCMSGTATGQVCRCNSIDGGACL